MSRGSIGLGFARYRRMFFKPFDRREHVPELLLNDLPFMLQRIEGFTDLYQVIAFALDLFERLLLCRHGLLKALDVLTKLPVVSLRVIERLSERFDALFKHFKTGEIHPPTP